MSEAELRERWEKLLSTKEKELLNMLWSDLKENYSEYIDDALRDSRLITDLVDLAEARIKYWRSGSERPKPVGRAAQTTVEVQISDYERECAETASLYLAKKAASLPELRRFRQERLGSRLLTTDEAKEFLRREELGDESDSDSLSEDDIGWIEAVNHMSAEELADLVTPEVSKRVYSVQDEIFPDSYQSPPVIVVGSRETLDYGDLIQYLTAIFPWAPDRAGWFLLTGERPEVVPLQFSFHRSRQVFTLYFAPWISEKTIRKAYRKGQEVVHGGDNRRMKERTLAVVRFVTEHTDDEGNRPSWSQLTDLWNKKHFGEWRFKERFGLRKTYLRGEEELAGTWR
jgi:hypothetical protein